MLASALLAGQESQDVDRPEDTGVAEPVPSAAPAEWNPASKAQEPANKGRSFTLTDAAILGLVEGITEYLPISSTGHLILANHFLGLNDDTPLPDLLDPRESVPEGQPAEAFSLKDAADAYIIIIQGGAIAAVLLLYWRSVLSVLLGFVGRSAEGLRLGRNLFIAFLPAVVIGLLLEESIDQHLFHLWPVVGALFAGGLLMLAVERWRRRRPVSAEGGPELHELTWIQALTIGLFQCLALWPGTSRSMVTIVGGYLAGLTPRRAAEFSFLLGLPTLTGASLYKGLKSGPQTLEVLGWAPILLGCVVAFVSAAVAVKFLVAWLTNRGLDLFAWYRIGIALVMVAIAAMAGPELKF